MSDAIRKGLADSFKHKLIEGAVCVACGRKGVPFALHVLEFYHSDSIATPSYLVPMSQSRGTTRGSVPLCDTCCPACNSCSLPIATPWVKKLLTALNSQHKGITFVVGNGFCRHVHVVKDLMSFFRSTTLAGIDTPASRKSPEPEDYEWKNEELAIYFRAQPKDPIWGALTEQKADVVQQGFLEIVRRTNLDKYSNTNTLPSEVIDTICDIANEVGKQNDLNPAFVILLAHQYVDADQVMRQLHKSRWVASMVSRSDFAPPAESYMKYIKSTYFSGGE
jgi:hypothetical protein